jgi:ankyrin repeat protein
MTDSRNKASVALLDASRAGDAKAVRAVLAAGADVSIEDADKFTPLELACEAGHAEVVRLLLSHGAPANRPNSSGWTPLMMASSEGSGSLEVVRALLEGGARVDGRYGYGAMSIAAANGHHEIAKLLLDRGADLMARSEDEPWFFAALFNGHVDVIRLALDRGVDVNVRAYDGGPTMLQFAEQSWASMSESSYTSLTANMGGQAAPPGRREAMRQFLLSRGARRDGSALTSMTGRDSLEAAVVEGRTDAVASFIRDGADPNQPDSRGGTLLHTAALFGWTEVVGVLVRAGAKVNAADAEGVTPLHHAASGGHAELVEALLRAGADPRLKDKKGETPVSRGMLPLVSTQGRDRQIMDLLLQHGGDPNVKDETTGFSPLHIAALTGDAQFARALLNAGAQPNTGNKLGGTPLHVAAQGGHPQIVQLLVDSGADLSAKASEGTTALELAAEKGHADVIKTLLASEADPNATPANRLAWSALHFAASNGHAETVRLLVEKGARVDAPDTHGVTALQLAVDDGNVSLVGQLLAAGANPRARAKDGTSPVEIARRKGIAEIEKLLLAGAASRAPGSLVPQSKPGPRDGAEGPLSRRSLLIGAAAAAGIGALALFAMRATQRHDNATPAVGQSSPNAVAQQANLQGHSSGAAPPSPAARWSRLENGTRRVPPELGQPFITAFPGGVARIEGMIERIAETMRTVTEQTILDDVTALESLPRPVSKKSAEARKLNEQGIEALKRNDTASASAAFQTAHQKNPADVEITDNRGYAYLQSGQLDDAAFYSILSILMSPRRATNWSTIGQVYALRGDGTAAVACFATSFCVSRSRDTTNQFYERLKNDNPHPEVRKAATEALDWVKREGVVANASAAAMQNTEREHRGSSGTSHR